MNRELIYRFLLLPFFLGLALFTTSFLAACGCKPPLGEKMQIFYTNNQTGKTLKIGPDMLILTKLIERIGTNLYRRISNEPTLVQQNQRFVTNQHTEAFLADLNSSDNTFFSRAILTVPSVKTIPNTTKKYPNIIVLDSATGKQKTVAQFEIAFMLNVQNRDKWKLILGFKQLVFKFPKQTKPPKPRIANDFCFKQPNGSCQSNLELVNFEFVDLQPL